jgi:CheY-like chemotaxis protein
VASGTAILCIDDDADTLKLRKLLLESSGYSVLTASSGAEGLDAVSHYSNIRLVILDYLMPGMAGDKVAEELKDRYPQLPLVLMSAVAQLPVGLLKRVDAYIQKGQDPEVLLATIEKILVSANHASTVQAGSRQAVLCVEDEELQLQLRKAIFESAGFLTLLAQSGAEAMKILRSYAVDAVVMDYWLSGMNGLAVAREMRKLRPNLPIVMLSGFASLPDETIGVVDAWYQKADSEPADLIRQVRGLIQHRGQAR